MEEDRDRYFGACEILGDLRAKEIWSKCISTNNRSKEITRVARLITQARNRLCKMENAFRVYLDEEEILVLRRNGEARTEYSRENTEAKIERDYRPPQVISDTRAFQNLTNLTVPEDIALVLSWGPKFTFPYILCAYNIENYLAQLDYTVEKTVPTALYDQVHREVANHIISDGPIHDEHIKWLLFLKYRMDSFFKKYPDIIPALADKGKITVLMYLGDYRNKTLVHLSDTRHYCKVDFDPLAGLVSTEMDLLNQLRKNDLTRELVTPYQNNCMQLPKFYVTIKVHKNNSVRPITSNAGDTVGANLNGVFNKILIRIFPPSRIHYKNATALKDQITKLEIERDDVLVSYDAISMFTSIPTSRIIQIIQSRMHSFEDVYKFEPYLVLRIANFLLNECVFFTAFGDIYKQTHGLPMGGAISPVCCRLIMDYIIHETLRIIPEPRFMGVYVDDTLFVLKDRNVETTLEALNSVEQCIQFTYELENAGCLNFLNLTLLRGLTNIKTNWFKKPLASNRLLNFYSSHKRSTIMNTAKQFIRTVIELSDGNLFMDNKHKIIVTLRENCFPETTIIMLIHEMYTLMRPMTNTIKRKDVEYVSFPHQLNNKNIKDIVRSYKTSNSILAESIRNNKINPIRVHKTRTPPDMRTNMIILATCVCQSKMKIQMTKFNQTCGMLEGTLTDPPGVCTNDYHVFRKFKFVRGLGSRQQTMKLMNFFQWKHRHKLYGTNFEFPNKYMRKIITNKFQDVIL